jgi:hypothetical protein
VFALGVTLHELVVGVRPHGLFRPPSEVLGPAAEVPPELDRVIARALSPDPRDRHPDAGAMLHDLVLGASPALEQPAPTAARGLAEPWHRGPEGAHVAALRAQLLRVGTALAVPACVMVTLGRWPTALAGALCLGLWAVLLRRLGRLT